MNESANIFKSYCSNQVWQLTTTPQECLTKLVACNTVSSTKEAEDHSTLEMIELLIQHFSKQHMFCIKLEQSKGKFNLLALSLETLKRLFGAQKDAAAYTESSPSNKEAALAHKEDSQYHKEHANKSGGLGLLLSGHADTVPFNTQAWQSDPLTLTEKDGKLYGRGSVDMKGFIACAAALSTLTACYADQTRSCSIKSEHTANDTSIQSAHTVEGTSHQSLHAATITPHKLMEQHAISCLITSDEETSMDGAQMMSLLAMKPLSSLGCSMATLIFDWYWAQQQAQSDTTLSTILKTLQAQTEFSPIFTQNTSPVSQNQDSYSYAAACSKQELSTASNKTTACNTTQNQLFCCNLHNTWLDQAFINRQFDLVIIGEPTQMQAVIAHKGWMARTLKVQGKTAHSSNPAQGCNALNLMHSVMTRLIELSQTLQISPRDERFAVPHVTLNLGRIHGGQAHNTVCDNVELDFDVRPIPLCNNQQIQRQLQKIVDEANQHFMLHDVSSKKNALEQSVIEQASTKQVAIEQASTNQVAIENCSVEQATADKTSINTTINDAAVTDALAEHKNTPSPVNLPFSLNIPFADIDCFENTDTTSLQLMKQAIVLVQESYPEQATLLDSEFKCVNYCTEASLLQKIGPCVILGPGNIAQAHQENEFIEIEQLNLCMQLLFAITDLAAHASKF